MEGGSEHWTALSFLRDGHRRKELIDLALKRDVPAAVGIWRSLFDASEIDFRDFSEENSELITLFLDQFIVHNEDRFIDRIINNFNLFTLV